MPKDDDSKVLWSWLDEQDPETRVRILMMADRMRAAHEKVRTSKHQKLSEDMALEVLFACGLRANETPGMTP